MRRSLCRVTLVAAATAFGLMGFACGKEDGGGNEGKPFVSTSPVVLNAVLQSNMVLQRNCDVPFREIGRAHV